MFVAKTEKSKVVKIFPLRIKELEEIFGKRQMFILIMQTFIFE